jgi:hypothetical protein
MLFLDTSAWAKLYLAEPERPLVAQARDQQGHLVVSALALPELSALLFRLAEVGMIQKTAAREKLAQALEDFERMDVVNLEETLAKEAAALARSKGLKGADAVQLASVAWLSREYQGVEFLAFDEALNRAATGLVKLWGH